MVYCTCFLKSFWYFGSANVLVDHCQNFLCMDGNVNDMQSPRRDDKAIEGVFKGGQGLIL